MGLLNEPRSVERPQFFNNQRLFAEDLQYLEAFNREMRWLHNQSLHQPGIGNGFAIQGEKGSREVTVGPGYALDVLGREIALIREQKLQVPPVAGNNDGGPVYYDLVVSYPSDQDLEEAETRTGICQTRGTVRLQEEPVFCWVRLRETESGDKGAENARLGKEIEGGFRLVVGRIVVRNCQLLSEPSLAQRRSARPSKCPYLACDDLDPIPCETYWFTDKDETIQSLVELIKIWLPVQSQIFASFMSTLNEAEEQSTDEGGSEVLFTSSANTPMMEFEPVEQVALQTLQYPNLFLGALGPIVLPLGLKFTVDTDCAGFQITPCYSARIAGPRVVTINLVTLAEKAGILNQFGFPEEIVNQLRKLLEVNVYVEGLLEIVDPQPSKFDVQIALLVQLLDIPGIITILRILTDANLLTHSVKLLPIFGVFVIEYMEEFICDFINKGEWSLHWMGVEG